MQRHDMQRTSQGARRWYSVLFLVPCTTPMLQMGLGKVWLAVVLWGGMHTIVVRKNILPSGPAGTGTSWCLGL